MKIGSNAPLQLVPTTTSMQIWRIRLALMGNTSVCLLSMCAFCAYYIRNGRKWPNSIFSQFSSDFWPKGVKCYPISIMRPDLQSSHQDASNWPQIEITIRTLFSGPHSNFKIPNWNRNPQTCSKTIFCPALNSGCSKAWENSPFAMTFKNDPNVNNPNEHDTTSTSQSQVLEQ